MGQQEQHQELHSWKEIANFLEVTPRTAQKWEQDRGLPVRHLPGPRGRVMAFVDELEAWKQTAKVAADEPRHSHPSPRFGPRTLIAAVALLTALGALWWRSKSQHPVAWRLEQSTLAVTDSRGRTLWRKALDGPVQDSYYYSSKPYRAWLGDLEGDGTVETLFSYTSADLHKNGSTLICFSEKGKEKWRFSPGKAVSTRVEKFAPPFVISNFAVAKLGRQPGLAIVVNSEHSLYYPQRVSLLSSSVQCRAEYWHSGRLPHLAVADLDGNGTNEILLAGTNNARKQAELVVLDPDSMNGASEESGNPDYQIEGFPPARELLRVLFPRTCINRKFEPRNTVSALAVLADSITVLVSERLAVEGGPRVVYHLTKQGDLKHVEFADSFRREHAALQAAGQIDHPITRDEENSMRQITVLRPR